MRAIELGRGNIAFEVIFGIPAVSAGLWRWLAAKFLYIKDLIPKLSINCYITMILSYF